MAEGKGKTRRSRRVSCRGCPVKNKQRRIIAEMIERLGARLTEQEGKDARVSVSDYIRLLQLQKEIEADEPKEIHVRWVDPSETESN